jgi:hypothetical protein
MQSRATAAHAVAMPSRARFTTAAVGLTAASIGLVTWVATMATAPRYSYGPDHDTGEPTYYFLLLPLAALAIGLVAPSRAWLLAALLGLPGLILSPWTVPRGDNDGLWVLIVPLLLLFVVVLMATARVGAWTRSRFRHGDSDRWRSARYPVTACRERVGFVIGPGRRRRWQQRWEQPRIVSLGRVGPAGCRGRPRRLWSRSRAAGATGGDRRCPRSYASRSWPGRTPEPGRAGCPAGIRSGWSGDVPSNPRGGTGLMSRATLGEERVVAHASTPRPRRTRGSPTPSTASWRPTMTARGTPASAER